MERTASFGYWLRRRRKALDLTQDELARQVGCAIGTIKKLEGDERRPSKQLAERLADLLQLPISERSAFLRAARAELSIDQLEITAPPIEVLAVDLVPPAPLPSGTVTFLFTDIEESTRLWAQYPEAMSAALAGHDAILHEAIATHEGTVVKSTGDGVLAVFALAAHALLAAHAAQRALGATAWSTPYPLRVRMALHTGAAELRAGDYYGASLNRAARVLAAGHGGQILLSATTWELVRDHVPPDATLRDLGAHWLKSLPRAERIYQFVVPEMLADFPPLRTLDRPVTNLPVQATTLVGREHEVAAVCDLVRDADVRLVTLTGPGGTGKTRLALQVASGLLDDFVDGAWFVALAPISDPELVASTIAQALNVRDSSGQPLLARLNRSLHEKHMLLLLDNFEQVVEAAPLIANLLAAAPQLKVLVTSRTALRLAGEHEVAVPPLTLPERMAPLDLERLTQYEAVRLFIARAQTVKANFVVTHTNAEAVVAICARLDGLPLAIELAARRVKLFPPQALLARLSDRLTFLTGGARDLPARQQTMRNTIDWSYNLLDEGEKWLFARLGVFVGGCTLEAAEAICTAGSQLSLAVEDGVAALLDKSLLRQEEQMGGVPRVMMLETIREFALERLAASGEAKQVRRTHATYFLALVEPDGRNTSPPPPPTWFKTVEEERDNLHAALAWSIECGEQDLALRLSVALGFFWLEKGHWIEGQRWLEAALVQRQQASNADGPDGLLIALRAQARIRAAWLANLQGNLGSARALGEQAVTDFRALEDPLLLAGALTVLACIVSAQAEQHTAWQLNEEALALYRVLGDRHGIARVLNHMGWQAHLRGDERAQLFLEQSLLEHQALGLDSMDSIYALHSLALVVLERGDYRRARELLMAGMRKERMFGNKEILIPYLEGFACLSMPEGSLRGEAAAGAQRAARCFGAAEAQWQEIGATLNALEAALRARHIALARAHLDQPSWDAAWSEGRAMTLEQAVAYALEASNASI